MPSMVSVVMGVMVVAVMLMVGMVIFTSPSPIPSGATNVMPQPSQFFGIMTLVMIFISLVLIVILVILVMAAPDLRQRTPEDLVAEEIERQRQREAETIQVQYESERRAINEARNPPNRWDNIEIDSPEDRLRGWGRFR